ncbi:MAG: TM1812 family CRISPR-associated protein, partial [Selenomonadaceae bacterium]|nr:TM1812 family CRISPR-associated protein [Selenomonadaceae bacterium]
MAKNILLLFLSPVKPNDDIKFVNIDGKEIKNSNEPAILYLAQKNIALDKIFIFASEMIRKPVANYLENGEPITHLNFFLKRLEEFLPGVDSFIFNYDEKISDDAKLKSVAEMANKIQEFAGDEETFLHVDLTGGMRDINMMMLDLTRLLEYSGLKIGTLVYSDLGKKKVEELRNIYDLFQLIAGVEEFVNFGSVTALKNYYSDKQLSEPLTNLLATMENFAAAIKLCHYGQFRDAIINLHDAVRDFKPAQDDTQDILMARLIGRIREDYHRLIVNRDLDDLEVIRWCLNHDYLQQALTLYTERVPEYLGEKKFLSQSEAEEKLLTDAVKNDDMGRKRFFYLFSEITPQ